MKADRRRSIGRLGESIAADYLVENGYTILERNWRSPYGEVDLITLKAGRLAFIEVKTRSNTSLGPPEISITPRKQRHMRESAEYYIQQHPEAAAEWCIDLVTVQILGETNPPMIDYFENVIQ
jgi:putative endonuclease